MRLIRIVAGKAEQRKTNPWVIIGQFFTFFFKIKRALDTVAFGYSAAIQLRWDSGVIIIHLTSACEWKADNKKCRSSLHGA